MSTATVIGVIYVLGYFAQLALTLAWLPHRERTAPADEPTWMRVLLWFGFAALWPVFWAYLFWRVVFR